MQPVLTELETPWLTSGGRYSTCTVGVTSLVELIWLWTIDSVVLRYTSMLWTYRTYRLSVVMVVGLATCQIRLIFSKYCVYVLCRPSRPVYDSNILDELFICSL